MILTELEHIILRVSAMNSYLRSEAHRRGHSGYLPHVAYFYKVECIKRCRSEGLAEHKRADVWTKCRDCGGDGKYVDSYGWTHDHCWRCSSTGRVHLQFVETTVPGAVWLTPKDKVWDFMGQTQIDQLPETAENWQINQPGQDLTPSQVAEHMCEIEAFFPLRPKPFYVQWDWGGNECDPYAAYSLWAGRADSPGCFLCGAEMDHLYGGHVTRTGRLYWSARICKACSDRKGAFDAMSRRIPDSLLTPEIRRWVERHPVAQTRQST